MLYFIAPVCDMQLIPYWKTALTFPEVTLLFTSFATILFLRPSYPSEAHGTEFCTILTPKIIFWLFSTTSETGKWQMCHILFILDINVYNFLSKVSYSLIILLLVSAAETYNLSPDTMVHLLWIRSCTRLVSRSLHRHSATHLLYFGWMMEH